MLNPSLSTSTRVNISISPRTQTCTVLGHSSIFLFLDFMALNDLIRNFEDL